MRDLFGVEGKVVLVTGGTSGIGEMIATGFAEAGAVVYVVSRKADACEETAARIRATGGRCSGFAADLAADGVELVAKMLEDEEGRLDVLVNNAGRTWGAPLDGYPVEAFDKVFGLNVTAPFALSQRLRGLLAKDADQADPGRIINIGSVEGLSVPEWENYAYPASMAALHMLTRQMARHLGRDPITVNAVAPGPFPSRMIAFAREDEEYWNEIERSIPLGRAGSAEDIVGPAIFLAARSGAYVTGAVLSVDGGLAGAGRT